MSDDLFEHLKNLESPHLWLRQQAAVELGRIGDLRSVNPLIDIYENDTFDEIKEVAYTALERIADNNGFETVQDLMGADFSFEEEEDLPLEEQTIRRISHSLINASGNCTEEKCPYYFEENEEKVYEGILTDDFFEKETKKGSCYISQIWKDRDFGRRAIAVIPAFLNEERLQAQSQALIGTHTSCQSCLTFYKEIYEKYYELNRQSKKKRDDVILEIFGKLVGRTQGSIGVKALVKRLTRFRTEKMLEYIEMLPSTQWTDRMKEILEHFLTTAFKDAPREPLREQVEQLKEKIEKQDKKSAKGKLATSLKLKGQLRINKEKEVQKVRLTRELQSKTSEYKAGREDSRKMIRPIQMAQVINLISFE
ncbi:MAG: HEAT repeat domain-containing protein [Candidatus Heimdallarchaeota archaeon]|nr:HEAT repeat domain-containing protein [Candidatus Heimdallarchaeota archaeon]MCK5049111.1 HEAT repeat domain-containing protein [Candidatus Heimdallarchaeota archaeon]